MRTWITSLALTVVPVMAAAQSTATVVENAPIYATNIPAANLAPLHIASVGTTLTVIGQGGDWWQVEFDDPKWGRRTGWVQKRHVRVTDPNLRVPVTATSASRPLVAKPPGIAVRVFADVSFTSFVADQSFENTLGSSTGLIYGGGGEVVVRQRIGLAARVGRYSKSGERVFIHDGQRFGLGIPLRVKVTPVMFAADYRLPHESLSFYVGGDGGLYRYEETSSFEDANEKVSGSHPAYGAHGGIHAQLSRWFGAGAEVRWITVPGALGEGGLSEEFDEDDLGGLSAAVKLTFGR